MDRLILVVPLDTEQIKASQYLMNMEGLCTCGRLLHRSDAKLILGNVGPSDSVDPKRRNTVTLAAYCYHCASHINEAMKRCKNGALGRSEAELRG